MKAMDKSVMLNRNKVWHLMKTLIWGILYLVWTLCTLMCFLVPATETFIQPQWSNMWLKDLMSLWTMCRFTEHAWKGKSFQCSIIRSFQRCTLLFRSSHLCSYNFLHLLFKLMDYAEKDIHHTHMHINNGIGLQLQFHEWEIRRLYSK